MSQSVLGGGKPRGGIGAEQGQRAERTFDRTAQVIVDDDAVEAVRVGAGKVIAGHRVAHSRRPAIRQRNNDAAIGGLEEPSVGQCLKDRNRTRVAQRAERDDRFFLGREAVAGKVPDQGREIIGLRRHRYREQTKQDRGESDEADPHPVRSAQHPLP